MGPVHLAQVENELTARIRWDGLTPAKLETGGHKIVTTISRSMEVEMYKAVNENLIAVDQHLRRHAAVVRAGRRRAAGPEDRRDHREYPGKGQNMSASECKSGDCDQNTAVYTREQVGSSFKPYVLSTAVSQGMNVKTSILDTSPTLYIPPEPDPLVLSTTDPAKAMPESFAVSNDGGEVISNKPGGAISVQNALAQSSNTAYTDLAHRVGTENIIQIAANIGVNIAAFPPGRA